MSWYARWSIVFLLPLLILPSSFPPFRFDSVGPEEGLSDCSVEIERFYLVIVVRDYTRSISGGDGRVVSIDSYGGLIGRNDRRCNVKEGKVIEVELVDSFETFIIGFETIFESSGGRSGMKQGLGG